MCNQIIKIALAQFDNDLNHINRTMSKIEEIVKKASQKKVDFLVFPELFLTGYDLPYIMEKNNILEINDERILSLCQMAKRNDISFLIGLPLRIQNRVYISALYINCEGNIEEIISKNYLYGMEREFFTPGTVAKLITIKGFRIGIGICFDSAHSEHITALKDRGIDMFIGSSLYSRGEGKKEMEHNFSQISSKYDILSAVVNYADKTGNWLSCGNSSFYDKTGHIYMKLAECKEGLLISQIQKDGTVCKYV